MKKYLPELAGKLEIDDIELYYALENLPILTLQTRFYDEQTELAKRLIAHRDSKDVDLLVLSLAIVPQYGHKIRILKG